jgi:O-antigen ligase
VLLSIFIVPLNKIRLNPIVIGLALIAFYSMLTSSISYYPLISFMKSISLLLLSVFLLLLKPTIQSLFPQIDAKIYLLRMFLNMSILIVLSNACYFIISPDASVLAGRFRGWFVNPNGVGAVYGIFFMPILAYEISKTKLRLTKFGLLFIFILASVELLATQSRAGIASGIISLLILILGQKKWDFRATIMSGLGIISLLIFLYDPKNNIFLRFIYRNETILQGSGRIEVWSEIWNSLSTKPIWGSGLGVSETGAELSGIAFSSIGYVIEKGNSLLAALDELGILGTGLLIIALIFPILEICWKGIIRTDNHSNLVLIAIVMAGLANSIFEAWLLSVGSIIAFSFWIFASLLFTAEIRNRGK